MFDNLKTLIMEGKSVQKLSINGKTVWESITNNVPDNVLLTADNELFMTANERYFVVKVEETTNGG